MPVRRVPHQVPGVRMLHSPPPLLPLALQLGRQGFIHLLSKLIEGSTPYYSTFNRRVNSLEIVLDESLIRPYNPISIAIDASGTEVHNGLDWI